MTLRKKTQQLISINLFLSVKILTLCILMDFPMHIDTISMGLLIVYLEGLQVEFYKELSQCMRFPTVWYVRPAKPQISLHYVQSDQSLC